MALGPELIIDGGFIGGINPLYWTPNNDCSYGNNSIILQNGGTFDVQIFQDIPTINGKRYRVQFDFLDIGSNNNTKYVGVGVGTNDFSEVYCSIGHQTIDVIADIPVGESGQFKFYGGQRNSFVEITNVSVIDLSNTYLQTVQMVGSDLSGDIQTFNAGKDDDGTPLYFELETQQLEFGNRSHLKKLSDRLVVFSKDGQGSTLESKLDNGDYKQIPANLTERVNILEDIDLEAHYLTLKWYGETDKSSPILEGFYIDEVSDLGMTEK